MGLVARTVPQVQILFVAMPIKVVVGMVVLMAALPATGQILNAVIGNSLAGSSLRLLEAS
jgi:flagellar biosynthesis protein FliR